MSKKLLLISILLFVALTPNVNAQNATNPNRPETVSDRLVEAQERKEALKALIQDKKDEKKFEIQTKRDEFKLKLQEIKDSRKQSIVMKTDTRLATLNEKATNKLTNALDKLETLLDKFASGVEDQKVEGKDTTDADAAITTAENAIEDAKTSVAEQAAKAYVVEIVDEDTLKNTVGTTVSSLRQDLREVFGVVKLAKEKVMDVARELAQLRGGDIGSDNRTQNETTNPGVTETPVATESSSI